MVTIDAYCYQPLDVFINVTNAVVLSIVIRRSTNSFILSVSDIIVALPMNVYVNLSCCEGQHDMFDMQHIDPERQKDTTH